MTATEGRERLHKVLAHSGVASRRRSEDLIREGRVRVNGKIVREMGVLVDRAKDEVTVDGESLRPQAMLHLLLYKPKGYLCTTSDQFGRKTILNLLPQHRGTRLFTVGRLDQDSEGLVVVTNDGELAHEVLHPKRRLPRTYYVKVRGHLTDEVISRAREGVWLADGRTPPMDVRMLHGGREVSTAKCTLVERHHHQLRRIWAKLGMPVLRLVLVRIASIGTERLKKGTARVLTPEEVEDLRRGEPGRLGDPVRPERAKRGDAKRGDPKRGDRRPAAGRSRPRRGPPEPKSEGWGAPAGRDRDEGREGRGRRPRDEGSGRRAQRDQRGRAPARSAGFSSSGRSLRKRGR